MIIGIGYMKRDYSDEETKHLEFKVRQAVGSMAIEGILADEATMLSIAEGRVSGEDIRKKLVKQFSTEGTNENSTHN